MILFEFLDPDCDSGSDDEDDNPLPSDGKWVNSIKVIGKHFIRSTEFDENLSQ